jgi:NitT/TauT family transport system ATP-binding protein
MRAIVDRPFPVLDALDTLRPRAKTRISVRNLSKTFSGNSGMVHAVSDVSFDVEEHKFVALLGPSGCGKSTVLNMIATLIPPTGGTIFIDDAPLGSPSTARKVGYVFQRDTTFPWRTVMQNAEYGLELAKVPKADRRERAEEMLAQVGLLDFKDAFPSQLSGGMRQRLALARTLITRPQILLMDEPFGALDTHTKIEMHKILLDLWGKERQTVLFVTHDLSEALTLSDRILLFSARPGMLKQSFEIDFPRPRDAVALPETTEYARAFSEIWHSLGEEFRKGKTQ